MRSMAAMMYGIVLFLLFLIKESFQIDGMVVASEQAAGQAVPCDDLGSLIGASKVICGENVTKKAFAFMNDECNARVSTFLAVVRPATTNDVAVVVRYIKEHGNLLLSVRSGGHSYTCNSAVANSVQMDLGDLNSNVELIENNIDESPHSAETKLLKFGSGHTFDDLLSVAPTSKFSFVHGECLSVGVGGYYLHGGVHLSRLTNLYGWGNESIRELEMVTADAAIIRIQESRQRINGNAHPPQYNRNPIKVWKDGVLLESGDSTVSNSSEYYHGLWTAIRKAGSSFAVVTSITVQVWERPTPRLWFFALKSTISDEDVAQLLEDSVSYDNVNLSVTSGLGFRTIVGVSLTNASKNSWINRYQAAQWLGQWLIARKGSSLGVLRHAKLLVTVLLQIANVAVEKQVDASGLLYQTSWVASSTLSLHSSTTAADRRNLIQRYRSFLDKRFARAYCWLALTTIDGRSSAGDWLLYTELNCGPVENYREELQQVERDSQINFPDYIKYANVPIAMATDEENQDVVARYYPNWLETLQQLKTKYDPANTFSRFQGILPA